MLLKIKKKKTYWLQRPATQLQKVAIEKENKITKNSPANGPIKGAHPLPPKGGKKPLPKKKNLPPPKRKLLLRNQGRSNEQLKLKSPSQKPGPTDFVTGLKEDPTSTLKKDYAGGHKKHSTGDGQQPKDPGSEGLSPRATEVKNKNSCKPHQPYEKKPNATAGRR